MGAQRRFSIGAALVGSAALLLAACGKAAESETTAAAPANATTTVEVVNHSSSDMDIYLLRMGDRVRIGTVPANLTTRLEVLPVQVAGVGTVRFLARPVLPGLSRGATSEPTVLHPGDVIQLDIPGP